MTHASPRRDFFRQAADRWDDLQAEMFGPAVRAAHATLAEGPGAMVLDVGCGTGYLAEAFLGGAGLVVGVDEALAMLAQARGKLAGGPSALVAAEAEALPFRGGSAGRVVANMLLHHVEEPPEAVGEMARVLAPGGWLTLTDLDTHTFEVLRTIHADRWLGFDRDEVAGWLRAAGLDEVRVEATGCTCRCGDEVAVTIFMARGRKPRAGERR